MLDERELAEKSQSTTAHLRIPRQLVSPVTKAAPPHAKKWMKRDKGNMSSHIADVHVNNSDVELFSESEKGGMDSELEHFFISEEN